MIFQLKLKSLVVVKKLLSTSYYLITLKLRNINGIVIEKFTILEKSTKITCRMYPHTVFVKIIELKIMISLRLVFIKNAILNSINYLSNSLFLFIFNWANSIFIFLLDLPTEHLMHNY